MAAKRGPTKGNRLLVELPFADKDKGNLVMLKQGVAKELGFKPATNIPVKKVTFKTAAGNRTAERLQLGSYKRRSVRLIFTKPRTIPGSKGNYKSVSLPLSRGASIADVVKYFSQEGGKNKGVAALITPDGKRIQWKEISLK